ncbi:substrate-binding domain-containing protein [Alkalibacterium iburiense]|uniref:Substrate-binding domain-containing protein n=1 Tax=Alkalibacterium iburiense TaxID=290589 RepID=A0ABN0XBM0_9LACT
MKKLFKWGTILGVSATLMACGADNGDDAETDTGDDTATDTSEDNSDSSDFDTSSTLHLVTREVGSGTRDAFAEMVGLTDGDNDLIDPAATAQQGTNAVNTTVADDQYAIAYTSVGALNDDIKPVQIDGVDATAENILSGDYSIARNFNVIVGEDLSEQAQDFWDFMFTAEGQEIVEEVGYIQADTEAPAYEGSDLELSGTIDINGSTSVYPVVEALAEAYSEIHPDVQISVHSTGSGAGVTAAIEGTTDIGMASRDLDDEETSQVTEVMPVALDGISVIVHPSNPLESLSVDQVADIFSGNVSTWDEILD